MNPTCKLAESSFKRRRQLVVPGAREQVYRTFPGADPNYTRRFAVQVASLDRTKPRQQLPQHQLVAQCYTRESCLPTWSRPMSDRSPLTVNPCQRLPTTAAARRTICSAQCAYFAIIRVLMYMRVPRLTPIDLQLEMSPFNLHRSIRSRYVRTAAHTANSLCKVPHVSQAGRHGPGQYTRLANDP